MIACHEAHSKTLPLLGNSPPSNSPRQLLPQPGNPTHPPLLGAAIEMLPLLGNLVLAVAIGTLLLLGNLVLAVAIGMLPLPGNHFPC